MVCPVFYHNNADGHTDACSSMDDPVVLFGVYNLPHQHHGLASTERRRQAKSQLDTAKTRFRIYASFLFFFVQCLHPKQTAPVLVQTQDRHLRPFQKSGGRVRWSQGRSRWPAGLCRWKRAAHFLPPQKTPSTPGRREGGKADCHCALSSHSCTGDQAALWLLSGAKRTEKERRLKKKA